MTSATQVEHCATHTSPDYREEGEQWCLKSSPAQSSDFQIKVTDTGPVIKFPNLAKTEIGTALDQSFADG